MDLGKGFSRGEDEDEAEPRISEASANSSDRESLLARAPDDKAITSLEEYKVCECDMISHLRQPIQTGTTHFPANQQWESMQCFHFVAQKASCVG